MDFKNFKYSNYIYIIVAIIILIYAIYQNFKNKFINNYINENYINESERIKKMNGFPNKLSLPFSKHYNTFKLFKEFVKLCDDNNIQYTLFGGLLIGLFRHNNSFVPWDDDIDIAMTQENLDKLNSVLKNDQFVSKTSFNVYKFTINNIYIDDNKPFIDIFLISKQDNVYNFVDKIHRYDWPNDYFYLNQIENFNKKEFHLYLPDGNIYDTIYVSIPTNPIEFLNRAYNGWENKYIYPRSHSNFYKIFPKFTVIR